MDVGGRARGRAAARVRGCDRRAGRRVRDPRGASSPVRVDTRADRRSYYAYSRSVWAEIQGDLEAAVQWSREALRFDPSSRVVRNHLASVLLKKGDFRAAIHEGEEILAQSPNDVQAHLLLAAAYQGLRNVRGGRAPLQRGHPAGPETARGLSFFSGICTRRHGTSPRPCRSSSRSYGSIHEATWRITAWAGSIWKRRSRRRPGRLPIRRRDQPGLRPGLGGLAGSLEVQGRNDEAVQVYQRALANDPRTGNSANAWLSSTCAAATWIPPWPPTRSSGAPIRRTSRF